MYFLFSRCWGFTRTWCGFQPPEPDRDPLFLRFAVLSTSESRYSSTGTCSPFEYSWISCSETPPADPHLNFIPKNDVTFQPLNHESIREWARVPRGGTKNSFVPSLMEDIVSSGLLLIEAKERLTSSTENQRASSSSDVSTSRLSFPSWKMQNYFGNLECFTLRKYNLYRWLWRGIQSLDCWLGKTNVETLYNLYSGQ